MYGAVNHVVDAVDIAAASGMTLSVVSGLRSKILLNKRTINSEMHRFLAYFSRCLLG